MTEVRVDNITDAAGTGKPDFEDGFTSEGAALSTLNTHEYSTTEPASPKNGSIWYDSGTIKIYVNDDWYTVNLNASAASGGVWYGDRGLIAGGTGPLNTIDYFDITSPGNATDFGDLDSARDQLTSSSDGSRAVFAGGYNNALSPNITANIDYVTTATTGNAVDFGDLVNGTYVLAKGVASDGTYGIFSGGVSSVLENTIHRITIQTTGDATDFGDLTETEYRASSCSDATYALIAGGNSAKTNIDYVTIATAGNASVFGSLSVGREDGAGLSDTTRGVFIGGWDSNVIDYVTIQTTGNATDFGDTYVTTAVKTIGACSNNTYGVYGGGEFFVNTSRTTDNIEYITIQTTGNASDFGNLATARYNTAGAAGAAA
jgi:hypothetical protein